jgi:hypothetical protein
MKLRSRTTIMGSSLTKGVLISPLATCQSMCQVIKMSIKQLKKKTIGLQEFNTVMSPFLLGFMMRSDQ